MGLFPESLAPADTGGPHATDVDLIPTCVIPPATWMLPGMPGTDPWTLVPGKGQGPVCFALGHSFNPCLTSLQRGDLAPEGQVSHPEVAALGLSHVCLVP